MVHRRELNGEIVVLGNQGDLYGNAMTWWDHETGSVWSQPLGEAIIGPLRGERLELMGSTLTTWDSWRRQRPDTLVLDVHAWDTRLRLEDVAIVVDFGEEAAAYGIEAVQRAGVVDDTVAGIDIVVVVDPNDVGQWGVFERPASGSGSDLKWTAGRLIDLATGDRHDAFTGENLSDPASSGLGRLPAFTSFPEDFHTFFPASSLWVGD